MKAEAVCMTSSFRADPRHVWLSHKCKAWCRWNQFNASKSPEMAPKVVEAQSNDQVHLLICEAVFAFQCARARPITAILNIR